MANKIWQLMPKIDNEFINKFPEFSPIVLQLLFNRALIEKEEIGRFLYPLENFSEISPNAFGKMAEAVDLIIKNIKEKNKIVIYGDYDADGVTSSAVLYETLRILKADVSVYIPDRVSEGYGLNIKAIDDIEKMGVGLIVTVDGGIRSNKEVEYAKNLGLEVIITDHHMPPDNDADLPKCLIINPNAKAEKYEFKYLAGVGVAYKVAKAIISSSKLPDEIKEKLTERVLDLVAIGTIADCVKLYGENRLLVKKGLEVLNKKKRVGIKCLVEAAQINGTRPLDSWNVGFQISPRLNAAGRMDHANTAFELLVTEDEEEAKNISMRLNERNSDRQKITEEIMAEVEKQINEGDQIIIGICPENYENESWKEGVIGLVAGRISEKYYRPALVITRVENGLKGSGRSIDEFNLIEAIEKAGEFLDKFGGHPSACGFSLKEENFKGFSEKIRLLAKEKLDKIDLRPKLKIEAEIKMIDVNEELFHEVEKFSPFGQNNEKPKFACFGVLIVDIMKMGINGQHIKLRLKSDNSRIISAIGFGQTEQWKDLAIGEKIDIVSYIDLNEFNGKKDVQLKIIDIKKHGQ